MSTILNDFSSETTKFHIQPTGPLVTKRCSNDLGHPTGPLVTKRCSNDLGHMTAMPMYRKNLKNLLQSQLTDGLETWGVASSIQVLQKYLNYDLDPLYANVKFGHYVFCMGKSENYFLETFAALGLKGG